MFRVVIPLLMIFQAQFCFADSWTAQMVDYGVYEIQREGKFDDERVASGLIISSGKKLLKKTTVIEAAVGSNFGFRYILKGPEEEAKATIRVLHPSQLRNPQTGKTFSTSEWEDWVPKDSINWNTGWSFEEKWELIPGEWVMQLLIDNKKLLEKKFTITVEKKPE